MDNGIMCRILDLYDKAKDDPEYMALHREYTPAQAAFANLLGRLPEQEQKIIGEYLRTSVGLYHRLLEMALDEND